MGRWLSFGLVEQISVVPRVRILEVAINLQGSCLFCVPLGVQLTPTSCSAPYFKDVHEILSVIE